MGFYKDCFMLMRDWEDMKFVSKKSICELCVPFRDMYGLSDLQTLRIARGEMSAKEILALGEIYEEW